jgi:uncharacterized membrane protein YozB (DUF420 family)
MSWNLIFWFYAYGLTMLALLLAFLGISAVRKGNIKRHHQFLNFACNLIVFFVISYVFKMIFLGREDKSDWGMYYKTVLYIHEALIATMLITGIRGRWLAFKFRDTLYQGEVTEAQAKMRRQHRLMGKWCVYSATFALITASVILYGMVQRA